MTRHRHAALLATTGLTLAATLTACGDPITASHNWRSLNALVTVTEKVGPATVSGYVLQGRLINAQGLPLLNTIVQETCARISAPTIPAMAFKCLTVINTGTNVYVAGGMANGPFGTLKSLNSTSATSTISFTKLSGAQPVTKPLLVEISAAKN